MSDLQTCIKCKKVQTVLRNPDGDPEFASCANDIYFGRAKEVERTGGSDFRIKNIEAGVFARQNVLTLTVEIEQEEIGSIIKLNEEESAEVIKLIESKVKKYLTHA